jgi:UPF0755 protein
VTKTRHDTEDKTPKPRRAGWRWLLFAALILTGIAGVSSVAAAFLFQPASASPQRIRVTIPEGAGAARIGQILEEKRVIRSAWAFGWYLRWRGEGATLKSGRYRLSANMSLAQIVQELQSGGAGPEEDGIRVTIPEGYTLRQIAETLEKKGVVEKTAFLEAATAEAAIAQLRADFDLPKTTLEGYLFPDTYFFRPRTPARQVIETMLLNFQTRFVRPNQRAIAQSGKTLHRLVTEASLIEREARVPEDRARIAGVIDNRLQRNMRLEVDATVLYALGRHKARVLYSDLEVDSPYNTYRHRGLPPGPIANPGLESLLAALRPEQHDFLYYVARPDGSHLFTRTLA